MCKILRGDKPIIMVLDIDAKTVVNYIVKTHGIMICTYEAVM